MIIELVVPEPDTIDIILSDAILTFIRDVFVIVLIVIVDGIDKLFIDADDAFIDDRWRVEH
jgi:hypothetical protein